MFDVLRSRALQGMLAAMVVMGVLAGTSGCAVLLLGGGAAGGVAGTKYVMGQLEAEVEASVPKVQEASVAGLESLSLPVLKNRGDKFVSQLESETADGDKIAIEVNSLTDTRSKISIRVGMLGDKDRSTRIWDAIRANLPKGESQAG